MVRIVSFVIILIFFTPGVLAGDIQWKGNYRFEALKVFRPDLENSSKAYILHHFTLRPKFTAYDGLTIHGRFDILNNSRFPNDQLGQSFGAGLNQTPTQRRAPGTGDLGSGTNVTNSNTFSDQLSSGLLAVNELYVNWDHEFGVITVGRAPMHFGLGMNFNGGFGMFDHWLENRDLIAYKMVMGHFHIMPVIAKTYEGKLSQEDDINDYIVQINYENPDTELEVGFIYQNRRSTSGENSNDSSPVVVGEGSTLSGNYEMNSYNAFVSQWVDQVKVAFEIGAMTGNMGLSKNGVEIEQDGFGAALKLWWMPKGSKWGGSFELGYASGDDPATEQVYEAYVFDQNYDVAFLLFNHPLGKRDFFRTSVLHNESTEGQPSPLSAQESFDSEAISNSIYTSAALHYKWNEKWSGEARFTYARLNNDPLNSNVNLNVGFELDLGLTYKPFKGFQWMNRAGLFTPGGAFEGGTLGLPSGNAFGFETRAAIYF